MATLLEITKNSLGIVNDSTMKDTELNMLIASAKADMRRQGIDIVQNIEDNLVIGTIVLYVKGNFGMLDVKDKENAMEMYRNNCANLSLSSEYKVVE